MLERSPDIALCIKNTSLLRHIRNSDVWVEQAELIGLTESEGKGGVPRFCGYGGLVVTSIHGCCVRRTTRK